MAKKLGFLSIILAFLTVLFGLAYMAYLGYYNRYWSDDWCYERDLKHLGLAQTLGTYFFTGDDAIRGYSTNRYSLTLLTVILDLPGMLGIQILPTLIIGFFITGLYWVSSNLMKKTLIPQRMVLAAVIFFTYYEFYISTQRFQILYWRAGVHYSATIIAALFICGMIVTQIPREKSDLTAYLIIGLLAFLGGGLSETGCVYLLTGFSMLLLAAWIGKRQGKEWARKAFPLIICVIIMLLIAMAVLILSPSNVRYKQKADNPIPVFMIPVLAPQFAFSFIFQSLKSLPLPHLFFILFYIGLAILAMGLSSDASAINHKQAFKLILFSITAAFILIIAIQIPSTYFYSAPPDARVQSLSRFTMLAALSTTAWVIGRLIGRSRYKKWLFGAAVITMMALSAYNVHLITTNYTDLAGFIHRAKLWDSRDAMIREAVSQGQTRIEVPVIDTQTIETRDIMRSVDMQEWVTNCTTQYYGVEAFHATSP